MREPFASADNYRQYIRQSFPLPSALHRETLELLESLIDKPRQHTTPAHRVVDMLFVQSYKGHVSVMLLAEHGHLEDAATITRRLLELTMTAAYIATPETDAERQQRACRFLAEMWHDLDQSIKDHLPANAAAYWEGVARGMQRGGLPSYQKMFAEAGALDTYAQDYSFLASVAHGASPLQLVDYSLDVVPVRPITHLGTLMVWASRYATGTTLVWNQFFSLVPQAPFDALFARLAAWTPASAPPPESAAA